MPKPLAAVLFATLISVVLAAFATAQPVPVPTPSPVETPTPVQAPTPVQTPTPVETPTPVQTPKSVETPRTLYRPPLDGKWHFAAIPYLWVPNINGSLHFNVPSIVPSDAGRTVDVGTSVGPSSYLSDLNFGLMFSGEVRRDALALYLDFINANLSSNTGKITTVSGPRGNVEIPINSALSSHLSSTLYELAPSYTVLHGPYGTVDFLVGYRSANLRSSVGWNLQGPIDLIPLNGSASLNKTFADFVTGLRGNVYLAKRWYIPYYADLGWGSNNSTWQAYGGVGYAGRTTDVVLVYRNLQYNDTALQVVRLGGPALGVVLHW